MNTINLKAAKQEGSFKDSKAVKYFAALIIGLVIGSSKVADTAMAVLYALFSLYCLFLALKGDLKTLFKFFPYFVYTEIYVRAFPSFLPNIYADYLFLAIFALLLLKQGSTFRLYSISFVFIGLYALIEIIDTVRTNEPDFARIHSVNSINLFLVTLWASSNILKLSTLNTLLNNFKIASIYLAGIVLAAHLFGHVEYNTGSSFAASNGLAPVQLSAYLGLGVVLLFLSIVNTLEKEDIFLNLLFFILLLILMLLTFSRGGLYFFAVIAVLYMLFNRKNLGSYFIFLILLPIGYIVYYYVVSATNGLIVDRYEQAGASGRDLLVEVGIKIFLSDPLAGIGTGNFSKEIVARHLYEVESGAHNEFIRAAAEHGIIGIITYWGFYLFLFFEIMSRRGVFRQYSLYFFALFCLILIHNGLKIVLQPTILILAVVTPAFAVTKKTK